MKRTINHLRTIGFLLAVSLISATCWAQTGLSADQWQEDLEYLQKKVHAEYPFLFKKITAKEFDAKVAELHAAIPYMEEHEIFVGLVRMVASFEYGHTLLGFWEGKVPLNNMPVVLYYYDDGVYFQAVHKDHEPLLGARLLEIDGVPVDKALEMMRPAIPAENDQFVKGYGIRYLTSPEFLHAQGITTELKKVLDLTIEKDGKVSHYNITAVPYEHYPNKYGMVVTGGDWLESRDISNTPLYLKHLDKIYYYEYLPEHKTLYVRHSQIQDQEGEDIPTFYKNVFEYIDNHDVEKLILDVRLNSGGNNYKNKPIVTGIIANKKINQTGKFIVIIGRRTFSACMNLVNELHTYTNAIFVGEPTAENINFYGDSRPETLPNSGVNAYLSFAWWQDKPQWENKDWLAPQIATGMTFEQYRTNQDPALEAALVFSDSSFISDPMAHLTALYTAGKFEEVESEAARMVQDPAYKFFDFETEFNKAGYQLLEINEVEGAIGIFGMNAKFFPNSANVWDSLAEAYWKSGDKVKAEEYYNKAINLDPKGRVGENAKKMLAEMKAQSH